MIPLRDINPTERTPVVTRALLVANVVIFLYQLSLGPEAGRELVYRFGMVPYYLTQDLRFHSLATPLTSMFMHGGIMHLASNMWFLHIFGDNVEDRLGRGRFLLFYVLCGLLAAAAQMLVDPSSEVPMVGASGAIAGVLGAYFRLFPGARVVALLPIFIFFIVRELPAFFFIIVWFLLQLVSGIGSLSYVGEASGGIAFFAHIGGFLAGLFWLRVLPPRPAGHARGRGRIGPRGRV
ncbi:MAG: rhomboid family intramembrane serine protease [Myxococcales bacterium]|nr:rhomboid family intramembrane serine protease [Myxococcales bacterium]